MGWKIEVNFRIVKSPVKFMGGMGEFMLSYFYRGALLGHQKDKSMGVVKHNNKIEGL